ncbi:MAG TPA: metal-dependent hydrolase [Methanomicrobiales archaeon]|nr:metal-dependent hydrolase [Methanomicrobiales archaeon]
MRRQTHLILGALGFIAYTYPLHLVLSLPPETMLVGFFAALFGSVMPDVLEPARDWTHRGLCHSRRAMRFVAYGFVFTAVMGLFEGYFTDLYLAYPASAFFLGYGVHLLADSLTPAGLPG